MDQQTGWPLYKKLNILNNRLFDDPNDAELLCAALDDPRANELDDETDSWCSDWADPAWYTIAWTLNRANSKAVLEVIRSKGLPKLKDRLEFALSSSARWAPISDREGTEHCCLCGESSHFLVLLSLLAINSDDDSTDLAVRADLGDTYYHHWLKALERIIADKGVSTPGLISNVTSAWHEAARGTPHGQPIELPPAKSHRV